MKLLSQGKRLKIPEVSLKDESTASVGIFNSIRENDPMRDTIGTIGSSISSGGVFRSRR